MFRLKLQIPLDNHAIVCVLPSEGYAFTTAGNYFQLTKNTDEVGQVVFKVRGWAYPPPTANCSFTHLGGRWKAGRILVGSQDISAQKWGGLAVAAPDLDGNGVGANDLSLWFSDFGCANGEPQDGPHYNSRSDYDGDGFIGANDLSLWFGVWGGGGSSTQNCP